MLRLTAARERAASAFFRISRRFRLASTKLRNSGWACVGFERNSGWHCTATNHGCVRQLDHLHQFAVRARAGEDHAVRGELLAILIVELVAMAVAFLDQLAAVDRRGRGCPRRDDTASCPAASCRPGR